MSGGLAYATENKIENDPGKIQKYFKTQNGIQFLTNQKIRLYKYKLRSDFSCLESL